MSLLTDILVWSQSELTDWQQDAVRRLFEKGSDLTVEDFCDSYELLKSAHGISCETPGEPLPLSQESLPAPAPSPRVVLKAMRDLTSVNRLAENQVLSFCPDGITVIYGANANGKSGYARVLKRACRARDQGHRAIRVFETCDTSRDSLTSRGTSAALRRFEESGCTRPSFGRR